MFRNLIVYKVDTCAIEGLVAALESKRFVECTSQQAKSVGWDTDARFIWSHCFLGVIVEERVLPARAVKLEVEKRAAELKARQGFQLGRRQKRELQESVIAELMPRALVVQRVTDVWVDMIDGWLGIDAPSDNRADEVLELIRRTVDNFPLKLVRTCISPTSLMCDWLAAGGDPASVFTVDKDCELQSVSEDNAAIRYSRHTLDGSDVREHLAGGKLPTRLALTYRDRVSFTLTDRLQLKGIKLLDVVTKAAEQDDTDADARRLLMAGEFRDLLTALVDALDGELAQ